MVKLPGKKAAFSLVEVIVTVGVAVVLIAILLPVYQVASRQAKQIRCMGNLRQFGTALLAYTADRQGLPWWNGQGGAQLEGERPNWESWVRPYLHHRFADRLRCPNLPAELKTPGSSTFCFNYGGNSALCIYYPNLKGIPVPASRVVLAAETGAHDLGFNHVVHFNMTMWGLGESAASGDHDSYETRQGPRAQYHGSPSRRSLNLFFLDGHMDNVTLSQGKDWRDEPVYGTASNNGLFFCRSQFKKIKANPAAYQ